jgi:predicted nucleic acid-binding protein
VEVFFDTSVLIAASVASHPHHTRAAAALQRVVAGRDRGHISAHSIAECFAVLTRLPIRPRIHPSDAARIINEGLLPHLQVAPLTPTHYAQALQWMVDGSWSGGKIYDALLLACAASTNAERICTFNLIDFQQLAPAGLQGRIAAP